MDGGVGHLGPHGKKAWLDRGLGWSRAGSAADSAAVGAHGSLRLCAAWPTDRVTGGSGPQSQGTEDEWQWEPCVGDSWGRNMGIR